MILTELSIRSLNPPERGQYIAWDSLKGFGVRVSPGGAKTFIVVHGRNRKKTTIGRVGVVTLKNAREAARNILAERRLRHYLPKSVKFETALGEFFEEHVELYNRPTTQRTTKRLLNSHFLPKLRHERLEHISPRDLATIITGLYSTPSEAAHAKVAISTFMRWCVRRSYLQNSPCEGLQAPKSRSRDRVLSDEELRAVLAAAPSHGVFGRIVLMLLYSGQREAQIAALRAEWVQEGTITFPAVVMKGKEPHTIPNGPAMAGLLGNRTEGLIFPSITGKQFSAWSKAKVAFDKDCRIAHWTLHDLRRTFSTNMAKLGVAPHVTERILAHRSGRISGVAAIYNRHTYLDEMHEAMEKWHAKVYALAPIG